MKQAFDKNQEEDIESGILLVETDSFPVLQYIPESIEKGKTVKLVLWMNGSELETGDKLINTSREKFGGIHRIVNDTNNVLITPIIPRERGFDAQTIERTTLFDTGCPDILHRPDKKVMRIITQRIEALRKMGFLMKPRIIGAGSSAGANFINRLSISRPSLFSKVILLKAGTFRYPAVSLDGVKLPYPLGMSDSSLYDEPDSLRKFKQIQHFLYVGEKDPNPGPLEFELHDEPDLVKSISSIIGKSSPERTRHFHEYITALGVDAKLFIGKGMGHKINDEGMDAVCEFINS